MKRLRVLSTTPQRLLSITFTLPILCHHHCNTQMKPANPNRGGHRHVSRHPRNEHCLRGVVSRLGRPFGAAHQPCPLLADADPAGPRDDIHRRGSLDVNIILRCSFRSKCNIVRPEDPLSYVDRVMRLFHFVVKPPQWSWDMFKPLPSSIPEAGQSSLDHSARQLNSHDWRNNRPLVYLQCAQVILGPPFDILHEAMLQRFFTIRLSS